MKLISKHGDQIEFEDRKVHITMLDVNTRENKAWMVVKLDSIHADDYVMDINLEQSLPGGKLQFVTLSIHNNPVTYDNGVFKWQCENIEYTVKMDSILGDFIFKHAYEKSTE